MDSRGVESMSAPGPDTSQVSSSLELDSYKEKVEHFKVLIRHLQQDIQSYKVRSQGAETVSKLLQESRQENQIMQKKYKALYTAAMNLKSRLEAHGLSSEVVLQEDETILPSNSKQLLDNLTRENKRLRSLIRDGSGSDVDEIHRDSQENVIELNRINQELSSRIKELEGVLESSSDQKDVTIAKLHEALAQSQRTISTRSNLCNSLAEEATTLRKQLRDVAERCQEMAQQLEEREVKVKKMKENVQQKTPDARDGVDVQTLIAEKTELQNKLADVTAMNSRWQTYCLERERVYQNKIAELSQELQQTKPSSGSLDVDAIRQQVQHEIMQEMNQILDAAKKSELQSDREKSQYKAQLEQTVAQLSKVTERNHQLEDQMRTLGRRTSQEDSETMEALKQQIQVCTEDFESERRDREKAQAKITRLESEIDQMKKESADLRKRLTCGAPMQYNYYDQGSGYNNYNVPNNYQGLHGSTLAARGINYNVCDSRKRQNLNVSDSSSRQNRGSDSSPVRTHDTDADADDTLAQEKSRLKSVDDDRFLSLSLIGEDEHINSVPEPGSSPRQTAARGPSPATPTKSSQILRCPKCGKEYTSESHADLLEHIEICCE